jgi:hypothetical protein
MSQTFALAMVSVLLTAPPGGSLLDALQTARKCAPSKDHLNAMVCDFDLGSLHFAILAVGKRDATVVVHRADSARDYQFGWSADKACITVMENMKRNKDALVPDIVFVSPFTGAAYTSERECEATRPPG